nr:MAG TPA: hypothetical protein [Caudoviricetes sp.]
MKSGNFVELEFIVKGLSQYELINAEHISRILFVEGTPYIGMMGSTYTRQLSQASYDKLVNCLNMSEL